MSSDIRYFIGVEGFNNRYSVAVLSTFDGRIRSSVRESSTMSLHATDRDALLVRLNKLLGNLLARAGLKIGALEQSAVCLSLTGVTFSFDRLVVLPRLLAQAEISIGRLICTGDAEVTFASHAQTSEGTLVLSHSGSTAYAVGLRDGVLRHYRFGGWGPAIGDEGSGYWIGREALHAIGKEHDAHSPKSLLWEEMSKWLASPGAGPVAWDDASQHWHVLLREFQQSSDQCPRMDPRTLIFAFAHRLALNDRDDTLRKAIAGLTVPVVQAMAGGDQTAAAIIRSAVAKLAQQHRDVCTVARERAGFEKFSPVVFYGSVLSYNEPVREMLKLQIEEDLGTPIRAITRFDKETMRPAMGSLMFSLGNSVTHALRLPPQAVIARIKEECLRPEFNVDLKND